MHLSVRAQADSPEPVSWVSRPGRVSAAQRSQLQLTSLPRAVRKSGVDAAVALRGRVKLGGLSRRAVRRARLAAALTAPPGPQALLLPGAAGSPCPPPWRIEAELPQPFVW